MKQKNSPEAAVILILPCEVIAGGRRSQEVVSMELSIVEPEGLLATIPPSV